MLKKQSIALLAGCTLIINPLQASLEEQEPQTYNEPNLQHQSSHSIDPELVKLILANIPNQIKIILKYLKNPPSSKRRIPRFLYLYGPPGCGKSTLAKAIAQETGRACEFVSAQDLHTKFKDSVSDSLHQIGQVVINSNIPYVLIIDEVEAITEMCDDPQSPEKGAFRALMSLLDKVKQVGHVLVIFTSNSKEKIPAALKSRLRRNIVEIPLPNKENKNDIIKYYLEKEEIPVNEELYTLIANGLPKKASARDIEEFITNAIDESEAALGKITITKEFIVQVQAEWKKNSEEKSSWQQGIDGAKKFIQSDCGKLFIVTTSLDALKSSIDYVIKRKFSNNKKSDDKKLTAQDKTAIKKTASILVALSRAKNSPDSFHNLKKYNKP